MTTVVDVERALEGAIRAEQAKRRALDDAIAVRDVKEADYVKSGTDADLDVVTRTRLKAERARKLHQEAVAEFDAARSAKHAAEVEKIRDQHRLDLLALPHFAEVLDGLHEQLIGVDRSLDSLAIAYAKAVAVAQAAHDEAADRAASIGATLGSIVRPTVADALLAARTKATRARHAEGRDDASELVSEADLRWQVEGMSAAERADIAQAASRARAAEQTERTARMTLAAIEEEEHAQ